MVKYVSAKGKEYEVEVTNVRFNDNYIELDWEATGIGFGTCSLFKDQNDELILDSEDMSKEFVQALFNDIIYNQSKLLTF